MNEKEIEERFYKELEFGNGRSARNHWCRHKPDEYLQRVERQHRGLQILSSKRMLKKKGVAVAFDSRNMSLEFAQEAALCLAANGIKAYVFPHFVRHRCSRLHLEHLDVRQGS